MGLLQQAHLLVGRLELQECLWEGRAQAHMRCPLLHAAPAGECVFVCDLTILDNLVPLFVGMVVHMLPTYGKEHVVRQIKCLFNQPKVNQSSPTTA